MLYEIVTVISVYRRFYIGIKICLNVSVCLFNDYNAFSSLKCNLPSIYLHQFVFFMLVDRCKNVVYVSLFCFIIPFAVLLRCEYVIFLEVMFCSKMTKLEWIMFVLYVYRIDEILLFYF